MIAKAIATYVKDHGIKQAYISNKTGLSKHAVSCALNGKRKLSVEEYEVICRALNVSYDFFFETSRKTA